jgi:hypothetical protein
MQTCNYIVIQNAADNKERKTRYLKIIWLQVNFDIHIFHYTA